MTNYLSQKGRGENKQKDDRICHRFLKDSSLFNGQDCCGSEQTDWGFTAEPLKKTTSARATPILTSLFLNLFHFSQLSNFDSDVACPSTHSLSAYLRAGRIFCYHYCYTVSLNLSKCIESRLL